MEITRWQECWKKSKEHPHEKHISLMPLEWSQAEKLVAETLHTETENTAALAEVLCTVNPG